MCQPLPGSEGRDVARGEGAITWAKTIDTLANRCPGGMPQKSSQEPHQFLDDLKFPNLLYGKVLRSPHAHANIKKIDKSKAEALKGVMAVVTWEDIPDWRGGTPRNVRVLDKKVRYVGDAVALVAATTEQVAEEALKLIEVEYEVLPAVFDIDSALMPDAPLLYEDLRKQHPAGRNHHLWTQLPERGCSRGCREGICRSRRHY